MPDPFTALPPAAGVPVKALAATALFALAILVACRSSPGARAVSPTARLPRRGQEISVCGQLYAVGTRVVLWNDPGGFDAYRLHRHFEPERDHPRDAPDRLRRFGKGRRHLPLDVATRVADGGWRVEDLARVVRQLVIHYDACGSSRECFRVLHDIRGLSCHFLLDTDGTLYQTLDLKERAWHAGSANDASVGIEIAHLGARPATTGAATDSGSTAGDVRGVVQGHDLVQAPFTEAQYRALEHLVPALLAILPGIAARFPVTADGAIVPQVLPDAGRDFSGILGHWHVSEHKVDPGPAFDWQRLRRCLR